MDYGMMQTDTFLAVTSMSQFQKTMMDLVQDQNFVAHGREIARQILNTEFSIAKGGFQLEDPRTGKRRFDSCGLPFLMWDEGLPYCAGKLRETGKKGDLDLADILEAKFLIIKSRVDEAHLLANKAIERNSQVGFFYYVLTLGADRESGLRNAKKGLKCPNLTGYVKYGLLYRAAEHASDLAIIKLQKARADVQVVQEGYAFAQSAFEDTKTYIQQAPPDGRSMLTVCYIHMLLLVLLHGHEQGTDLPQLHKTRELLSIGEEAARHVGRSVMPTLRRLAIFTIIDHLPAAAKEWGEITERYAETVKENDLDKDKAGDSLAAWLEHVEIGDTNNVGESLHGSHYFNTTFRFDDVTLYRCSWCGNPSAILRKCKGCGKTRYCDGACQKEHWAASHRRACARKHEQESEE